MSEYTPENLAKWTRPDHYAGAEWPGFYVFLGRHRDSDLLTQSNYECGLRALRPNGPDETDPNGKGVQVVCEGHWAVGWVEWIAIHESETDALREADEMAGALADYPILDESDFSEREFAEVLDYWDGWRDSDGSKPDRITLGNRLDAWRSFMRGREHWDAKAHNLPPFAAIRHPLHTLSERYPAFEQYVHEYVNSN